MSTTPSGPFSRSSRRAGATGPQRFELTHFLTFGTLMWPQFAFLMPTPYVLGPVGGGEHIPLMMRRAVSRRSGAKIVFRALAQKALYLSPGFWANILRADRILTRTAGDPGPAAALRARQVRTLPRNRDAGLDGGHPAAGPRRRGPYHCSLSGG